MKHTLIKKIKSLLLPVLLLIMTVSQAQTTVAETAATGGSNTNTVATILTLVTIIFIFVIWGMTQVLFALAKLVRDKQKSLQGMKVASLVLLFFAGGELYAQTTEAVVVKSRLIGGLDENLFYAFVAVITIELFVIAFLTFAIRRMYEELLPEKQAEALTESRLLKWWTAMDKKIFTKAVPVEKEADVMLDHDYDGIRELDNALPPWWKYGFYVTIFVGVIYMFNFHVFGYGKNPTEEYQAEMEKARIQKEIYEAQNKDKVDEEHVPMADAAGIAKGSEIFHAPAMCWSCHGQNAEGGAGPNLTDDYWIHKGSLNDIYKSIKIGYSDKGMQSWEKNFTPKEISYLASYIKSLRGSNPAGAQPPKGDLYVEEVGDSAVAAVKDTVIKTK